MDLLEIIEIWKSQGINMNDGIRPSEIALLEKRVGFSFPGSFKQFYMLADGFKDGECNENFFSLFSLERILEEYESGKNKTFIPFCDYLFNSHQIGFCKLVPGVFIDYTGALGEMNDKVADSFEGCLVELINDSDKIY